MIRKTLFALLSISLIACNNNGGTTTIAGNVDEGVDTLYLSRLEPQEIVQLDTTAVKSGKFSFTVKDTSIEFFMLSTKDQYRIPLFITPGEKVKVSITGTGEDRKYTIEGSEESKRILMVSNVVEDAMERIDSLNTVNQTYQDSANYAEISLQLNEAFEKIVEDSRNRMKAMIDEKPGSIANLFIFPQSIGNFPLFNPTEDLEYYEKALAGLEENYPNNKHTLNFKDRIIKLREAVAANKKLEEAKSQLVPGSPVPDIELTGPDGNTHKLSSLKGKVVLVDFWAAWCKPCRAENPNLVRMYNEYKGKGFDVYSVSLDGLPQQPNPKADWEQAIAKDGLTWPNHVSELKGWSSSVVKKFGFNGIPFTILVDREGNIIDINLRGPKLEEKLKEILG